MHSFDMNSPLVICFMCYVREVSPMPCKECTDYKGTRNSIHNTHTCILHGFGDFLYAFEV